MAKKTTKKRNTKKTPKADTGKPKFPYTTLPGVLRSLLKEIPNRPKPTTVSSSTVKAWNLSSNNNSSTAVTVLKKIGLLDSNGSPNDNYVGFMKAGTGPGVLASLLRSTYQTLFENSKEPYNDSSEALKSLFNIYSGGAESTIDYQIATFKALTDFADFGDMPVATSPISGDQDSATYQSKQSSTGNGPVIHIDLHIHLPPNKSARDYEAIIQDIGRYIYHPESQSDDS